MILAAFRPARSRELAAVRDELMAVSQSLQDTSHELVKTLDEMLEETNRANKRAPYHVSITDAREDHKH